MATIGAMALMRSQSIAHLGLDPLQPAHHAALVRAVVTLNARLPALASHAAAHDPRPWQQLATACQAADQVQKAAQAGQFTTTPAQAQAYEAPAGIAMSQWQPLISGVAALAPLIAATSQLTSPALAPSLATASRSGASQTSEATAQPLATGCSKALAQAIRQMLAMPAPPPLAGAAPVATLIAGFAAIAQLRQSLNVDPLQLGFGDVAKLVADRVTRAAAAIPKQAAPPRAAFCPTGSASAAAVQAALSPAGAELAAITWQVPPATSLPMLASVLPAAALAGALTAVLPAPAFRRSPCGACSARG
jgi:hypothetical protein